MLIAGYILQYKGRKKGGKGGGHGAKGKGQNRR
jgi:hypothetical protein